MPENNKGSIQIKMARDVETLSGHNVVLFDTATRNILYLSPRLDDELRAGASRPSTGAFQVPELITDPDERKMMDNLLDTICSDLEVCHSLLADSQVALLGRIGGSRPRCFKSICVENDADGKPLTVLSVEIPNMRLLYQKVVLVDTTNRILHVYDRQSGTWMNKNINLIITPAEHRILHLAEEGMGVKQISDATHLSLDQVKKMRTKLCRQLQALNIAEACTAASHLGLI